MATLMLVVHTFITPASQIAEAVSASKMTKYRVYQYDKPLKEFVTETEAVYYAKHYSSSHVEQITDRRWLWDNFPRYKVYQNGRSTSRMEFLTSGEALAYARTLKNASIRDLENVGWMYNSYPNYRLYQGDITLPQWTFATLDEAKKEAVKWSNAHIIDLNTNKWTWDNLTAAQVKEQSSAQAVYQLVVDGEPAKDIKLYSFLKNAKEASRSIANSQVVNTASQKIVYSNIPAYELRQNGNLVQAYVGLSEAVSRAKTLANAEILHDGRPIWSSYPYFEVYQGNRKIKAYHKLSSAIGFAKYYANITIRVPDGRPLWSNVKKLQILGWNGSSASSTIMTHVSGTQGLSINSPSWFELTSADGSLKDLSDPAVVKMIKDQGIAVTPLVHNGFNRTLTTQFLNNEDAQTRFVNALVSRLSELDVYGVNLDFEEVAGADRAAYTSFVKKLTTAAHEKHLKVSIDLPRGSVSWNHLTAYDHASIGAIVDTVIIMAYDEHWKGSERPGSVAGLKWTEEGIKQYLDYGIPRNKLMLGIPFYVREWRIGTDGALVDNRAIFMKDLPKLIADNHAIGVFDPHAGQWKFTYSKNGYTHVFWAETHETVLSRMALAKAYDLKGIAAWRLGYEDSELWTQILRAR